MSAVQTLKGRSQVTGLPEPSHALSEAVAAGFPSFDVASPTPLDALNGINPFGAALRARHVVRPECGTGQRDFLSFPRGLWVAHSRFRLIVDSTGACHGQDLFKMHFSLAGHNTLRYADRGEYVLRGPCLSMSLQPAGVSKLDCHPRDALEHSITLACRAAFLSEALRLDPDMLPPALARCARGLAPEPFFIILPLPARVVKVAEELLSPACSAHVAHLHAEARVLDLLYLGLDLLIDDPRRARRLLSPRDRCGLQCLRERIGREFLQPMSLAALACEAGLNRTKLTEGFRELFGETMHQYVTRLRMQHARRMIEEGYAASQVAMDLGYQHQSSFSTAFHAYFGYVPRALRKTRRAGRQSRRNSKKRL